jgi:sporulation protein YlmC with PRC-barrel domain
MRLSALAAGTALLLAPAAAFAQSNATPANTPSAAQSDANQSSATADSLRTHVRDMLQSSGFSDIRMMPSSFMIRAKDQDGNPVVMSVSPDSVTEVAELGTSGTNGANGTSASEAPASSPRFVPVANNDELSSNLVGLDVYNNSNQDIGQIKDIAMGPHGRARAYILSVGGFLGMGEHYVAVNPNDIKVSYNDSKWHATTNATTAELKSAAAFQYNGRWNASKS